MKPLGPFGVIGLVLTGISSAIGQDDVVDALDPYLSISAFRDNLRIRLHGLIDLEAYALQQPPPGLIITDHDFLFNPRLSLFLEGQIGTALYGFVQARFDRGFDPRDGGANVRLDEYVLRLHLLDQGRLDLQVGKYATVVGNWVKRHDSWENPFINAPLPYENLVGLWDVAAPGVATTVLFWGHVDGYDDGDYSDNVRRIPIIWGPSYASGIALSGRLGPFDYAAEIKNASLSSRPETWSLTETGFDNPTISARLGFRPNVMWNFGFSASDGTYLQPSASVTLPAGRGIGDYHQLVLGQDISFAWRHLEIWAECYEARFEIPNIGNADTISAYVEAKYKITPQLYAALRWNQQLYASIRDSQEKRVTWGNDVQRLDSALGYRLTPHLQLKLQYSISYEDLVIRDYHHTVGVQMTLKF